MVSDLQANASRYFQRPGVTGRLSATAARALFIGAITYAAVSGLLPALLVWGVKLGQISSPEVINAIGAGPAEVWQTLVDFHGLALAMAAILTLGSASLDVLRTRDRQVETLCASPIHTAKAHGTAEPSA